MTRRAIRLGLLAGLALGSTVAWGTAGGDDDPDVTLPPAPPSNAIQTTGPSSMDPGRAEAEPVQDRATPDPDRNTPSPGAGGMEPGSLHASEDAATRAHHEWVEGIWSSP
jgi:hypothetical protein